MWIGGIRHEKLNCNLDNNLFIVLLTDCNMIKLKNGGFGFYE